MKEENGVPNRVPETEPDIGPMLRAVRERRGLSLAQAEESTKIRARYLSALERGDFDVLPAVYTLGSLRTYADFLGLDGRTLSRELKGRLEPEEPDGGAGEPAPLEPGDDYEAAPVAAAGLNQLFLGVGMLLVFALAVMTLVSAVARHEEPKVSQLDEPSVRQTSQEMALVPAAKPERRLERKPGQEAGREDEPRGAGEAGSGEKGGARDTADPARDGGERKAGASSPFDGVKFIPYPPTGVLSAAGAPGAGRQEAMSYPGPLPDETVTPSAASVNVASVTAAGGNPASANAAGAGYGGGDYRLERQTRRGPRPAGNGGDGLVAGVAVGVERGAGERGVAR